MPDAYLRGPIAYHETMAEILALDRDCSKRHTGWVAELEANRDDYREAVDAVGNGVDGVTRASREAMQGRLTMSRPDIG